MALNRQRFTDDGKKTDTKSTKQNVTVGGRNVTVDKPKTTTTTTKQTVSVGGRDIKVDAPTPKYAQNKPTVKSNRPQNVTVGGRDITNQVVQQKKNEALNVPKSNPVIDKVKDVVNNVFQMAGVETGRMKLKNDYTAQRNQAKLESVNAQNMELANTTTPEMYSKMFTPSGQRVDNSKEIEGIRNEMRQLDARIAEIGNDDMAIAEISRRSELQEQLDAFDDLNKRAQAIEELSTQNWYRENGDEQGLAQYQEMLSHKNDNILERSANALNHLGNTTANIIPTAFDQMEELGSNKMAMDSIATLEEMHNAGEIDDATYLESLAEWQDFIDVHKSTNSDNLSQVIRANADRLSANTYYGASDIEKFCLQAGESTAQFLLHFALLGEGATISMSLASGTDKMNQLLMQGVDPQTAAQNGLMSGLVSYATEKIGMDRFVNMMGTPFSADALGSIVLNQLKSGLSEGLEEVAEGLVDPLIDYATLGIPYEVNGDELKMEFLLGGASGLAMAVGGTVIGTAQEAMGVNAYLNERRTAREAVMNQNGGLIINTQYQKNQVIDEINMLKKHYDTMTEHQKEVAREVIAKGENAIRNFEQMSQVQGVVLSMDIPETTSTEENNQAIYQTYTPDFNNEVRFEQKIKETESIIDELTKNQIAIDEMNGQTQQILNENGYDIDAKVFNSIDEKQQQQTLLAHDFAKALGYDVDIVNGLGKNIHGSRSKETGRITIDASMGKNPVLQTLAHEITHGTESGSRYDELKRLVRSNFTDEQWNAEIERVQDVYKRNAKQELAPEDAEKEIIAKYVEHNLNDEQFIEDLIRYNFSLASRIKQNMKSFFSSDENQNFKTTYERVFKTARDEMIDKTLQAIKDGFEGMVGENYVSKDNLQMSVAQYDVTGREILKRYLSDPENDISEESKNAILDRMEEVYKAMKEFEETGKYPQFSQWQDTFYSINDRGDLSVVINNGDYELNIDFSTVCKKRKMMDKVINALTKNGYLTKALKNTDIAKIREIIDKHGFEVACGLCFVDTKRFNQGSWAGRFETKWNGLIDQLSGALDIDDNEVNTFNFQAGLTDASPSLQNIDFSDPRLASFVALSQGGSEESKMARALMNNPSLRAKVSTNDMYGSSGFEALQKANPELFRLVNASGGSSKPKLAHTEVTYFNEIINSPKFNPEEAKKVGGVRLQSFSDFMTNMVFDYVQMFGDMEAKKLTGHSYTKVKEYALLFGKTGMKINLSLIPAGFDSDVYTAEDIAKMGKKSKEFLKLKENAGLKENGDYMFDKESFDFDLAVEIQNLDGYDKNVGTICVGVSDKHILKLLGDDRICMVIPYHRSGISPLVADKMGISTFNDYTNKQNTRFKKANGKPGKKVGKGFDFNFYEGSDVNGVHFAGMIENNYDAKKTADSYKAWCEANDYVPKFGDNPEILNHPNYYKLLIDFRAYDKNGNVAPQESVKISGDSGIGTEYVPLDAKANPKLAELYGDNIGFNNVLQKGLDVYEETEANQNEAIDPISQEVIDELGLEKNQFSVDDYGYHYGSPELDLKKKSERLSSRSGRGTGAFGTGTYFFGDGRFKSSYMTDKGKTEHKVDFSDYNLFRPKTTEEGYALHDALKSLDDNYGFVNENSLEEYLGEIENIRDEMLALVGEEQEDSNRPRLDIDDLDVDADDFMEQLEKRSREFERAYGEYEANRPVQDYDRLSPEDDEYNYLLNRLINVGMDEDEAHDLFNRNADETGDVDLRKVVKELVTNYLNYKDRRTYDVPYSVRGRINFENNRNVAYKLSKVLNVPTSELSDIIKTAMLNSKEESTRPDFREKMYDSVGTKVMKALGYEGIDVRNMEGLDNSTYGSVIYDLKPETIQYSVDSETNEVAKTNDSGDVVPPTRVNGEVVDGYGEQKTQRFASSNIPKSQIFNEEQQEQVREEVAEGKFTYNSLSNKVEVQRAREWMERDGIDATYEKFMSNNSPTVKSAVQGEVLLQELAKNNDPRWHDVAVKMADDGTVLGQALQAYSIMQRLTPEGQLVAVRRNMERLQRQLENMYGKDAPQLELKPELEEELRTAKTPEEAENARDRIQKDLIGQMPITLSSMIDAWRYLAMLGNPRTHVRNILGNAMFIPAIELKNAIGTAMEKMAGGKLEYRTKAILTNSKADKALIDFGKKEYQVYKGLIEKQQKYERKSFSEKTVVGKALNKASDFNSKLLDKEDFIFSEDRYARSFAQFLKANNLTEENITGDMRQRANAYALLEAEKATYRDANDIADWFNELEHSDKKGFRMASYVKKAVLPFTKTPMNIIKRGLRYSPAGLVETITYGAYELSKGKVTANQWIDNMASGMSGTMITLLGMLLTSMGLFRTKDDDSTRKNYYDSENGEQDYAIDLSPLGIEGTYTVDWMSPVIMPFAMGSELYSAFSELTGIDGVESVAGLVADTVSNLMDPIVETSMLSSLKDTMKSYSTSGGEYFGQVLLAVASNYIQQMFPTIGGQIARTIDDTRRTTYPNKGFFDKTWRQIRNKIPGLSKLNEPYINKEGKAEKTEDLGMGAFGRLVLNTLSPGYYSSKDIDEYDEEMYRLFSETGEESVLPSATSSSLTYEKENYKFTPEQYTQWHQVRYETESKYVNSFIDSEVYKNLSDEERIATIKDIRSYAQKVAKKDFLDSLGIDYEDKQLKQADGALDNGIELYSFYDYLNNAGTKQAEKVQYLEQSGLSKQQKDYLWSLSDYKASYEDVYKKVFDSSSSKKKSSTSKKKSSNKATGGSTGRITKAKSGGKISPLSMATPATRDTNIANNFFRAYSNTFNRGRGTSSTSSGNTIVCPRCGNRVSSGTNVCPICGTRL